METHSEADSGLEMGAMSGGAGGAMSSLTGGASGAAAGTGSDGRGGSAGVAGATGGTGGASGTSAGTGTGGDTSGSGGDSGTGGAASGGTGSEGCVDAECPSGGSCVDGACACPEGEHACGARCVSDDSPDSCGESCDPCEKPTGGDAICEDGACTPTCPEGERPCAGTCLSNAMACTGECPGSSHDCGGVCLDNSSVNGCGPSSCDACAVPTFGTASCDGTRCDFECDNTHEKCGDKCIAPSGCCDASECDASALCSNDNVCDCAGGQKKCGSGSAVTCWPAGSCCAAADCSNGFACADGECLSFCEQQTRPGDVAASDYQCLDFDTSSALPWTTTLDSGTAATSSTRAHSLPRSFKSTYTANVADNSNGTMSWDAVGAGSITATKVSFRVHPDQLATPQPPFEGRIDLMCIQASGHLQCLSYTNLGTLYPSSGPAMTNYTGYFVHAELSGGAFLSFDCPLTRSLSQNAWNTVEYDGRANGTILFNGSSAGACAGQGGGTTQKVVLGLRERGPAANNWAVYYDNVIVSVRR